MAKFEDEIKNNGYIVYTNKGDSMMPLLREDRDLMVIRAITEPLAVDDAVLFKRPNGAYVLHRIVKVLDEDNFLIGGDNRTFEEIVPREWIFGILTEIIRDGKHYSVDSEWYRKYLRDLHIKRRWTKIKRFPRRVAGKIVRTIKNK